MIASWILLSGQDLWQTGGGIPCEKKFTNGSCQLEDLNGVTHKNRVNGLWLKKYNVRIMQVSLCGAAVMKNAKVENLMDEDILYELQDMFLNELQDMNVFSMGVGKIW